MQLLVGPPLRALRARVGVVLRVPGVGVAGSLVSACAALACVHVFTRCFLCENLKQMPTFFMFALFVCVCVLFGGFQQLSRFFVNAQTVWVKHVNVLQG